jgi:hypothetical protein
MLQEGRDSLAVLSLESKEAKYLNAEKIMESLTEQKAKM